MDEDVELRERRLAKCISEHPHGGTGAVWRESESIWENMGMCPHDRLHGKPSMLEESTD